MRRTEKEITDRGEIDGIIRRAPVCRLALSHNDRPYLVPVCFGYRDNAIFFHSAREGRKIEILKKNPRVCFEMEADVRITTGEAACRWSMKYYSVIGEGRAVIVEGRAEKIRAFDAIMAHYSGPVGEYELESLDNSLIIRIEIERLTGKKSGW